MASRQGGRVFICIGRHEAVIIFVYPIFSQSDCATTFSTAVLLPSHAQNRHDRSSTDTRMLDHLSLKVPVDTGHGDLQLPGALGQEERQPNRKSLMFLSDKRLAFVFCNS